MHSLAKALRRPNGERRGRATLRLAMVTAIVAAQSIQVGASAGLLGATAVWAFPSVCLGGLAVSLGFSAAADRATSTARKVVKDRLRRAYPIYAFAILAAAFVLGPALTDGGRTAYFRGGGVFAYLLNLVAIPHYELPGVFEFNDLPRIVNAGVWVAPVYVVLLAIGCLPIRDRWISLAPAVFAMVIALASLILQGLDSVPTDNDLAILLTRGDGLTVLFGGLMGMALYRAQQYVPMNFMVAAGAAALLAGAAVAGNPGWLGTAAFRIATALPAAYLVVFLSVRRLALAGLARRLEPYLAGLFLLVFPLQQAVAERGPERQGFLLNLAIAGPAALALSAVFWHLVGRRIALPHADVTIADGHTGAMDGPIDLRWVRRIRRDIVLRNLAITIVVGGLFIGVMALVYVAIQPDPAS